MFAYCVDTTRDMCGITSNLFTERDMTVVATFEGKSVYIDQIRYEEETPLPDN